MYVYLNFHLKKHRKFNSSKILSQNAYILDLETILWAREAKLCFVYNNVPIGRLYTIIKIPTESYKEKEAWRERMIRNEMQMS